MAFIRRCLVNAPEDVLQSILKEVLGGKANKLPPSVQGRQQLYKALETAVKDRSMTWFEFAQFLLRTKSTRPFIFYIEKEKHTGGESCRLEACKIRLKLPIGSLSQALFVMCSRQC